VSVGKNTVIGTGEPIPNELRPNIYDSGITVVGEKAVVPADMQIGKNVMIASNVAEEDYSSTCISSGESVFKGGVRE